jgi:hypothetical protein
MSMYGTLLEVAEDLATDAEAKAAFSRDPDAFLAERGLEDLSAEDLGTALEHVADSLPPELSVQLAPPAADAPPTEVLARLAEVEPAAPDELGFGTGIDADGQDPSDHPDAEAPDETGEVGGTDDAGEADEAGDDAGPAPWSDAVSEPELDEDGGGADDPDGDLGFGQGADGASEPDDLPDDLPDA